MSTTVTHAYGLDTSSMHSSQVPAQTPRVQRNLVKDIVAQFNQEATKRETVSRQHSYEPADGYSNSNGNGNGYSSHKSSPSPPNLSSRHIYPLPLNHRSKSELSLSTPPGDGGGVVYAQVHVVNGSRNGEPAPNKYKTTVHTLHQPSSSHRLAYSNKLAKSTGSLNRSQLNEEDEEEDDRVLNTLNHKSSANSQQSYYRFDDPSNGSLSNGNGNGNGYGKIVKKRHNSNSDEVFESSNTRNGGHIIPLRTSNGFSEVTESPKPIFHTKNVEKWSEKEDLPGNRKKYTEHEKVHLVTMSNDSYDGHRKPTPPLLKSLTKSEDLFAEEDKFGHLRRHRDVTASPVGSNYSKKISTMEDSKVQRTRTLTPEVSPLRSPRKVTSGYYFGQPATKNVTSRQHVTENFRENEQSSWHSRGRRHSTDSGSSAVLLSSRLVKQADAELNDYSPRSPTLPPLVTSTWRREAEDEALKSISPRLRPLSPSSGISSVNSGKETRAEERHFRKQETTKTTKHEEHKGTPSYRRSRSADRYLRLPLESNHNQENEAVRKVQERRSASSTARRRLDKQFGNYYDEDRMETSGSDAQLYGGSQGSNMSIGSAHDDHHHHHHHHQQHHFRRLANDKENIISAHSNTPTSMLKNANKNALSYENTQRRQSNDTASTSSGRRMWFERVNDEVDDVKLSTNSATMSRLESKKNRRNHVADNEMSVNTVDRRDVMRRRRNKDVRHAERAHAHQLARSSSFNSRIDNYHSEMENESQASSTASKPKRVNFKANGKTNGFLSPMHREALLRSTSPARAPSIASNDSEMSNRSVILHATAVADIPAPAQYRQRSANTSPAPSLTGSGDGRSSSMSRGSKQKESRTVQRSFSLLSPWKPRRYKEKATSASATSVSASAARHEESAVKSSQSKKSQESLSHNSSSGERLDSLSPLPSEVPVKSKKKAGILRRRHSMPKDSRFANFFKRKNKESKKKS